MAELLRLASFCKNSLPKIPLGPTWISPVPLCLIRAGSIIRKAPRGLESRLWWTCVKGSLDIFHSSRISLRRQAGSQQRKFLRRELRMAGRKSLLSGDQPSDQVIPLDYPFSRLSTALRQRYVGTSGIIADCMGRRGRNGANSF